MINLIKKLLLLTFISLTSLPIGAFSSSSFLISQSAFKNYDYSKTLLSFQTERVKLYNINLIDKLIASVVTQDMFLANSIAEKILLEDSENQEANIVKLIYLYSKNKFDQINKLNNSYKNNNNFINFIFFNDNDLKNNTEISKAILDIVVSSFSNVDESSLNYNFLLFYTSLSNIIHPKNDRAILIKAELFQNINKIDAAKILYKKIKSSSPYYLEAQRGLAISFSNYSKYEEAENNIKKILVKNNNEYSLKKILADFYRVKKKYKPAIMIYDQMIKQQNDDLWRIIYLRGICYERLGNWERAEKDFLTSLEIKPDSPNVLNYLAYGWVEREIHLDESLKMLISAYEANPDSYHIIDSLAWAYFKKNNLDEAARLMEKVIDIAPGEAISLDHLGDIYYAMNRKREAIHFWQQALELAEAEDDIQEDVQIKIDKFNAG